MPITTNANRKARRTAKAKEDARARRQARAAARSKARLEAPPTLSEMDPELLLGQSTVAQIIDTTEKFLEARRVRGDGIPFCKIGRLVRYRVGDVRAYIQGNRMTSTSGKGEEDDAAV